MIKLLKKINIDIVDVICITEKVDLDGAKKIEKVTGIKIKSLLKFTAKGDKSKILEINGEKHD